VGRSTAYYRTVVGRQKRDSLNEKRCRWKTEEPPSPSLLVAEEAPATGPDLKPETLAYMRTATSLLEGRRVSEGEILAALERKWRQRGMAAGRRMDYVVKRLHEEQPDD
jgi:hypothetical protein